MIFPIHRSANQGLKISGGENYLHWMHTDFFLLLVFKWDRVIIACGSHIMLHSVSVIFSLLGESTWGNHPSKERFTLVEFEIPEHHGTDGHGSKGMKQLVTWHHSLDAERWVLAFSTFSPLYSVWKHTYQVGQLASRVALLASVKPSWESPHEHSQLVLSPVKPAWRLATENGVSYWEMM